MARSKNVYLKAAIEKKELKLKEKLLDMQLSVTESCIPLFGTPYDYHDLTHHHGEPIPGGIAPVFGKDQFQASSTTIRTVAQLDFIRNRAKFLYERNPNARATITGMRSFVVGTGFVEKVVAKDSEDVDELKGMIKKANDFLKEFHEANNLDELYNEVFTRSNNEGEAFLRLFPQEDGPTLLRAIEPDFIRSPLNVGEGTVGPWSWGILTDERDTQTALEYNVIYPFTIEEEKVSAEWIKHFKINVNANVKRGLPTLYTCFEELEGVQILRNSSRIGDTVRSSISYVREHAAADEVTVQAMVDASHTGSFTQHTKDGSRTVDTEKAIAGMVQDVPKGLQFRDPPKSTTAEAVNKSILAGLSAVAARNIVPLWLVSGENSSNSFASSLTSESPFVKRMEYLQSQNTRYWKGLLTAVIKIGMEQKKLSKNTLEVLEVALTAPSVRTRNVKERVEAQEVLAAHGLLSNQTWSVESDLDYASEQSKRREEEETMLKPSVSVLAPKRDGPETPSGEMQKMQDNPTT